MSTGVLIADDHQLVQEGIAHLLDKEFFKVAAVAHNGDEAITAYHRHKPGLVLMDFSMPGKSGLDAAAEILEKDPKAKIVLLTMSLSERNVMTALTLGVRGYLVKTVDSNALNQALRLIMGGETVFPAITFRKPGMTEGDGLETLTPRELEILHHISRGESNKIIARELNLAEGTVKVHVKSVLRKLGMENRTQMAIYAHEKGIY